MSNCRNCKKELSKVFKEYCYCPDCIIEGMENGFRLDYVTGITPFKAAPPWGTGWIFKEGTIVDVKKCIDIFRKLNSLHMSDEEIRLTFPENLCKPEFEDHVPLVVEVGSDLD